MILVGIYLFKAKYFSKKKKAKLEKKIKKHMCIFVCLTLFCHHKAFANIS